MYLRSMLKGWITDKELKGITTRKSGQEISLTDLDNCELAQRIEVIKKAYSTCWLMLHKVMKLLMRHSKIMMCASILML